MIKSFLVKEWMIVKRMKNMSNVLAIIPARGGSKGIKDKNIKDICGKPLISWTLDQALTELGHLNVLLTTDSNEIFDVAKRYGHRFLYKRPAELATDTALTEPTMDHAVRWYIKEVETPNYIMLLQPTSPIRFPGRLKEIVQYIENTDLDSLVSVVADHSFHWKNLERPQASYEPKARPRRQDISIEDRQYRENGSIYLTKTEKFLENSCRISGRIGLFEMEQIESYEIDTQVDWILNESLMESLL